MCLNLIYTLLRKSLLGFLLSARLAGKLHVSEEGGQYGRGQGALGRIAPCWSAKQQLWHFFKGKLSLSFKAEKGILARGQTQQVKRQTMKKRVVCLEENESGLGEKNSLALLKQ